MTHEEAKAAAYRLYKWLRGERQTVTIRRFKEAEWFLVRWVSKLKDANEFIVLYYAADELKDVYSLLYRAERYKNGLRITAEFRYKWEDSDVLQAPEDAGYDKEVELKKKFICPRCGQPEMIYRPEHGRATANSDGIVQVPTREDWWCCHCAYLTYERPTEVKK